ncbi:MAG TPA: hypothetical protein VNV43_08235 [Candidatus Acidoferrales bacterium]|nr:hypothetical protein [Candidatus Acidoferrales bacterium]
MALTNCPMCSGSLENAAETKTCTRCGADLSRFIPKAAPAPQPPMPVAQVEMPAAETVSSASGDFNLGLGVAGAVGGALVGMGLMYGFYAVSGMRFPLLGVGTGFLTAFGARWFYKGPDHTLGFICAFTAMMGVVGALVLMYGVDFSPMNIISIAVSASVAYKIAAR